MPRNGSGVSSVVNTFVIDTVADPDEVNANFTDVADQLTNSLPRDGQAGMNAPLPLQNGTAALPALTFSSDTDTGIYRSAANEISVSVNGLQKHVFNSSGGYIPKGADIASAATTDLSTATGDYVNITGTTTITSFGTAPAGTRRTLKFASTPIITHGANIILANGVSFAPLGDTVFEFVSEGSGVWREVSNVAARGSYTPTAVATSGTITAYTASGSWIRQNGCVSVEITVDISNNGTGAQSVAVSVPFANNATFRSIFTGINVATGKSITGNLAPSGSNMGCIYYDNTYPGATGATIRLTGFYFL